VLTNLPAAEAALLHKRIASVRDKVKEKIAASENYSGTSRERMLR
jgi:hypothetical protein